MYKTILCGAALAAAATVAAQDYRAQPTYSTLNLTSGFTPDPTVVNVQSGGSRNASSVGSGCTGSIANAPDVRLNYNAGSLPMIISVSSSADTTLVVNGPDGSWYCDDDGGTYGSNPQVRFNSPQSGQYDIWIGSYNGGQENARLYISELSSQ